MSDDNQDWSRLPEGNLVVDGAITFVTERASTPADVYRIRSEMLPGWEATGLSQAEVFMMAKNEVAQRKADGRLPGGS